MVICWRLLKTQTVLKTPWLEVEKRTYELSDGKVDDYYILIRPHYVLILAIDEKENLVVEKQYRPGVDRLVYELPAGWVGKDETPEQAAERELREETGHVAKTSKLLGTLFAQPGFSSMEAHVILVEIDSRKSSKQSDRDEFISYELVPINKVESMIKNNEILDMGFVAAFNLYKLYP